MGSRTKTNIWGLGDMRYASSRKNVATKKDAQAVFDNHVRNYLKEVNTQNFLQIQQMKKEPIMVKYSAGEQKIYFLTGKSCLSSFDTKSEIPSSFFESLINDYLSAKIQGATLEQLSRHFTNSVLIEVTKRIKPYSNQKEVVFTKKSRELAFRAMIDLGTKYPKSVQTIDTITNHALKLYPEHFEKQISDEGLFLVQRKIGYLFVDMIRGGMVGFYFVKKGEYFFDFTNVIFKFKDNRVEMISCEEFIPRKGIFWTDDDSAKLAKGKAHVKAEIKMSENHPLKSIFTEFNIPEKYLPRSKKDLNTLKNYCAKNYSRIEFNKINQVLNDWAT